MAVLILSTEALSALARPRSAPRRHERVRTALRSAEWRNEPGPIYEIASRPQGVGHSEKQTTLDVEVR